MCPTSTVADFWPETKIRNGCQGGNHGTVHPGSGYTWACPEPMRMNYPDVAPVLSVPNIDDSRPDCFHTRIQGTSGTPVYLDLGPWVCPGPGWTRVSSTRGPSKHFSKLEYTRVHPGSGYTRDPGIPRPRVHIPGPCSTRNGHETALKLASGVQIDLNQDGLRRVGSSAP